MAWRADAAQKTWLCWAVVSPKEPGRQKSSAALQSLNHLLFWPEYAPMLQATAGVISDITTCLTGTKQRDWRIQDGKGQGWNTRQLIFPKHSTRFICFQPSIIFLKQLWSCQIYNTKNEVYGQSSTTCNDIPSGGYVHTQNNLSPKYLFSWPDLESWKWAKCTTVWAKWTPTRQNV